MMWPFLVHSYNKKEREREKKWALYYVCDERSEAKMCMYVLCYNKTKREFEFLL